MAFGIPESVARRVTMLVALALLALSAGPARAAVAVVSGFSLAGTAAPSSATYTLAASVTPQGTSGTNRLMVVVLTLKTSGALTDTTSYTVDGTFGSAKLFQAAMTGAATGNPTAAVWIGCLKDAQVGTTAQSLSLVISSKGPTITGASMFVGFFSGVSQQWSVADSSSKSNATSPAAVPTSIFSPSSPDLGGYVTAAAAPAAAPSVSGYTSVTNTTNVGAFVGYKLGAGTDTPSATSTSVPLAIASISLNPDSYVGVGDGTPGSIAPMVAILNPGNNEIVSRHSTSGFKVQARVFSPKNGTNPQTLSSVKLFVNGSDASNNLIWSPKYLGTTGESGVYETTYNPATDGTYALQVQATNASGTVVSSPVSITTKAPGTGDGNLLVRDNSSQLCGACHALPIHSSETSGNRLGSWAVVCRDCHQPHATTNIFLVAQSVTPPSVSKPASPSPVVLTTTARTTGGIVNPQMNGICQGCHTRTTDAVGTPLFRSNVAPDAGHNPGQDCMSCHGHASGFPKPASGLTCHDCHGTALPRADNMPAEPVPPIDTCGNTQGKVASAGAGPNRVGAHKAHLLGQTFTKTGTVTCDQCHNPSPHSGHPGPVCSTATADRAVFTFGTNATGGTGWGGTTTPVYSYGTTQTCATVYCHGAFRNSGIAATPAWNNSVTCGGCHRNSNGTSAAPAFPHPFRASDLTGSTCGTCHPATSTPPSTSSTTHVNGTLDQISYGCSQCHGELSTASPGVLPGTPTNAAPGATTTAKDVAGATAIGTTAVGAHLSHLAKTNFRSTVIACNQCHVVPAAGDTAHATGAGTGGARATLSWGNLANGTVQGWTTKTPTYTGSNTATFTTPNYGTTAGTCGTVFCHGAFPNGPNTATGYNRTWNGVYSATLTSTILTCAPGASNPSTSCHGSGTDAQPAAAPHTAGSNGWGCGGCHSTGYSWNGTTGTVDKTVHINGKADASAGGPDCLGCHGATAKGNRRAVAADFTKNSHHVRGAMASGNTGSGVGNNYDCVVCHMEGQIVTAAGLAADCPTGTFPTTCTNPRYHQNKKIDLRDVDVTAPAVDTLGTAFTYDVDTIGTTGKPGTWGSAGGAANWQAQNQILDSFCLNCHDSNGASQIASFKLSAETARTPTDPYYDGVLTNTYDAKTRPTIVNIKDMVVAGAGDLELAGDPRPPNGVPDPPNGIYSRHAIRGKSLSVYKTTGGIPSGNWNTGWNDMAVMSCADCHTNDGANGTSGNAHGSGSDYLLKDATGGATRGSGNTTYVCARCHVAAAYALGTHVPNGNYIDGRGTNGSIFGIACLNCHGGAGGDVGSAQNPTTPESVFTSGVNEQAGFGRLHGTSSIFTNGAGGTRKAYRFTNGGSLSYYNPGTGTGAAQWQGASGYCYTITAGDQWSTCVKHSNTTFTKAVVRNLSY